MNIKILIVDDESIMRESLKKALECQNGYVVTTSNTGQDAVEKINRYSFNVVITDIKMPGISGLELLQIIKKSSPETAVIMMTAYGTVETAVTAMKNGAYDYLTKPFSVDELEVVVKKALEHQKILNENIYLREEINSTYNFGQIIGQSPKMKEIYELIKRVSMSSATVLIQGESGTGKELVARAIHYNGPRKNEAFIKVNCAALTSSLLESELFGHEKGAFTNAFNKRLGRFELADKGTLLLDEISEMEPALQAKLLRVLQEGEFDRVGGTRTIKVDVRILSTTNRNLSEEVNNNRFRQDLFYRLNVIPIVLPPLRERKEDIPLLAKHFLDKYNRKNGKKIKTITEEAIALMMDYDWPGNVRELENSIERAVVLSIDDKLSVEHFSFIRETNRERISEDTPTTLFEIEKKAIFDALTKCGGNKTRAAQLLDITVRTLRNKLKLYSQEENFSYKRD